MSEHKTMELSEVALGAGAELLKQAGMSTPSPPHCAHAEVQADLQVMETADLMKISMEILATPLVASPSPAMLVVLAAIAANLNRDEPIDWTTSD